MFPGTTAIPVAGLNRYTLSASQLIIVASGNAPNTVAYSYPITWDTSDEIVEGVITLGPGAGEFTVNNSGVYCIDVMISVERAIQPGSEPYDDGRLYLLQVSNDVTLGNYTKRDNATLVGDIGSIETIFRTGFCGYLKSGEILRLVFENWTSHVYILHAETSAMHVSQII